MIFKIHHNWMHIILLFHHNVQFQLCFLLEEPLREKRGLWPSLTFIIVRLTRCITDLIMNFTQEGSDRCVDLQVLTKTQG